jgi:hypothetical protein
MGFYERLETWLHGATKVAAVALVAGAGFFATADRADALTFTNCNLLVPDATGKLVANDGCQGEGTNSNLAGADFNGLFGKNGWLLLAKQDVTGSNPPNNINLDEKGVTFKSSDNNNSGTWSVGQSVYNQWQHVVIYMKDGNQSPATNIFYLVSAASGTWNTPWVNNQGAANNSLSNVQFLVNGQIPLPAAAWLLLAGIGGMGLVARGRKAAA